MTAKIAAVDLLAGLITLDAVTATARVVKVKGKKLRKTGNAKIVGLTIGGRPIDIGVGAEHRDQGPRPGEGDHQRAAPS